VNERLWSIVSSARNLSVRTQDGIGAAGEIVLEFLRTGTAVSEAKFVKKVTSTELEASTASGSLELRSPGGTRSG
jgi:hypothetical protein